MQAVPVAAVPLAVPPTASVWPSLLPGPFIILLLLPAIPLVLFSVGARPPESNALPFTTDDLWQTTAIVTVAGAVVLCLVFYPGAFSEIGGWVRSKPGNRWRWRDFALPGTGRSVGTPRRIGPVQGARGYRNAHGQRISSAHPPVVPSVTGRNVLQIPQDPRIFPNLATKHLAYLHESPLGQWYSPASPSSLLPPLLLGVVISFFLLYALRSVISASYDADHEAYRSAVKEGKHEQWVKDQVRLRESCKDDDERLRRKLGEMRERDEKEVKQMSEGEKEEWGRKRREKEGELRRKCKERELPSLGLDPKDQKDRDKRREGDKDRAASLSVKSEEKREDGGGQDERGENGSDKEEKRTGIGRRLERFFLGKQLSEAMDRQKTVIETEETFTAQVPSGQPRSEGRSARGPGWQPSDEAVTHATIARSTASAQALADRMAAERRGV